MSTSAWLMMISTWGVIGFFTIRFFLLIARKPIDRDGRPE